MTVSVTRSGSADSAQLLFYGDDGLLCHLSMYDGGVVYVDD